MLAWGQRKRVSSSFSICAEQREYTGENLSPCNTKLCKTETVLCNKCHRKTLSLGWIGRAQVLCQIDFKTQYEEEGYETESWPDDCWIRYL